MGCPFAFVKVIIMLLKVALICTSPTASTLTTLFFAAAFADVDEDCCFAIDKII
jgi:hypothetical protein